jgi:hypothetical protein
VDLAVKAALVLKIKINYYNSQAPPAMDFLHPEHLQIPMQILFTAFYLYNKLPFHRMGINILNVIITRIF